jgi:hypothetical protein
MLSAHAGEETMRPGAAAQRVRLKFNYLLRLELRAGACMAMEWPRGANTILFVMARPAPERWKKEGSLGGLDLCLLFSFGGKAIFLTDQRSSVEVFGGSNCASTRLVPDRGVYVPLVARMHVRVVYVHAFR